MTIINLLYCKFVSDHKAILLLLLLFKKVKVLYRTSLSRSKYYKQPI